MEQLLLVSEEQLSERHLDLGEGGRLGGVLGMGDLLRPLGDLDRSGLLIDPLESLLEECALELLTFLSTDSLLGERCGDFGLVSMRGESRVSLGDLPLEYERRPRSRCLGDQFLSWGDLALESLLGDLGLCLGDSRLLTIDLPDETDLDLDFDFDNESVPDCDLEVLFSP